MDFRVELADQAQRDIATIYDWLRSHQAGDAGERWFVALRSAVGSLASLPSRCPLAPENRDSPVEVRQLLYGERPHVYRILFAIEGDMVQVLHIRNGRRRPAKLPGTIAEPSRDCVLTSLPAQCGDWIDARGAPRRNESGDSGDCSEDERGGSERDRVGGGYAE
jgi:toxin ParE1/3/4